MMYVFMVIITFALLSFVVKAASSKNKIDKDIPSLIIFIVTLVLSIFWPGALFFAVLFMVSEVYGHYILLKKDTFTQVIIDHFKKRGTDE